METISVTSCPTCGALAQSLPDNKWRSVEHVHTVYDFIRMLYSMEFNKSSEDLSIPEVMNSLMDKAENKKVSVLS